MWIEALPFTYRPDHRYKARQLSDISVGYRMDARSSVLLVVVNSVRSLPWGQIIRIPKLGPLIS